MQLLRFLGSAKGDLREKRKKGTEDRVNIITGLKENNLDENTGL